MIPIPIPLFRECKIWIKVYHKENLIALSIVFPNRPELMEEAKIFRDKLQNKRDTLLARQKFLIKLLTEKRGNPYIQSLIHMRQQGVGLHRISTLGRGVAFKLRTLKQQTEGWEFLNPVKLPRKELWDKYTRALLEEYDEKITRIADWNTDE